MQHPTKLPYKVAVEIDIDCEELVLDYDGFTDVFEQAPLCMTNEQTLGTALLNHELGEYVTKVTAYLPSGDTITFE